MTTDQTGADRDNGRPKCGGARRGEGAGKTCTRPAGWGTDHVGAGRCKLHGGSTKTHSVAAQRVLAEQAMRTYGIRRDLPPAIALLEEFSWSLGHVAWLRDVVAELEPEALVWGVPEEHDKSAGEFPGVDVKRLAAPSVWLRLYHDERRLMLDLGKTIESLRLDARRVELAEAQGAQLAEIIRRFVERLGLSGDQVALVPSALREAIAAVTGPKVIEGVAA